MWDLIPSDIKSGIIVRVCVCVCVQVFHTLKLSLIVLHMSTFGLPWWLSGKEFSPAMQETQVQSLGREDPLEEGMGIHSSILAWKIPWTEEPGGL